jgi:glycosyltransferase involved in cell wall biosynthesis
MKAKKDIKVLYFTHLSAFNIFGGAEIQMLKTKKYLEKRGCFIKLFDVFCDKLDDYDILHIFQMRSDVLSLFNLARHKGLKTVLSPIWWESPPLSGFFAKIGLVALARSYLNWKTYKILTSRELYPFKDFLEHADIILPNSRMEVELLIQDFRVDRKKFWVVPNGVDERFAAAKPDLFIEKYGMSDFVLFVGRIEIRKNLLNIINVCKELKMPLVVIGHVDPFGRDYYAQCLKAAQSSKLIRMLSFLPHDSEELLSAYAAARVFVLPSYFETPGLTALEAGLAGCNLVITNQGPTKEYFGEYAWYVNPWSIKDLGMKIKDAYERPKSIRLKKLILENYTWEKVAERTLEAYKSILS